MCGIPWLQPAVSDTCGTLRLGERPTRDERIAWERRERGSCASLIKHLERFPRGAFRLEAASLLNARRVMSVEVWTPAARTLTLFEPAADLVFANQAVAQAAALSRASARAKRLCRGFASTTLFRLKSSAPAAKLWDCQRTANGVTCAMEGEAVCQLEERRTQELESCGK
jgi:hypothetical protein